MPDAFNDGHGFTGSGSAGGLDEDSGQLSTRHIRAEDAERRRARREPQDRCNCLELCPVGCNVRVVNYSPHPGNVWTGDGINVRGTGEQDSVLFEHSVHRLMLSTNGVPVQLEPNGKSLLGACHSKRSVEAQADLALADDMDISFEPLCFPLRLDEYGIPWRTKSAEKMPDVLVTLPLRTLGRFSASPGTSKLRAI